MIAIINYGAGNLASLGNALTKLRQPWKIAAAPKECAGAEKIILPGVGAAANAMRELAARDFLKTLREWRRPLLGICLGMQLFARRSDEDGGVDCLAVASGTVEKISGNIKVPHMGWNRLIIKGKSRLMEGLKSGSYFYFVHSYRLLTNEENICATTLYGEELCAAFERANLFGTQFHPEKSGENGLFLLNNFCTLC